MKEILLPILMGAGLLGAVVSAAFGLYFTFEGNIGEAIGCLFAAIICGIAAKAAKHLDNENEKS